ncbi:MAG: hypothetical protein CM1200mP36_04720 [Gammaproteobacteria bacterium]|nr:MAG: hypothetical protein CM1200mP36_04720 [Gammaproteobacteria bacterium]
MQSRKDKIVKQLTGGIEALFKSNGVTSFKGHGRLLSGNEVEITEDDGSASVIAAKHVVLASGSAPVELPIAPFDNDRIVDSWGALELESAPQKLGVIGAGVVGLELGSVWQRLGSEVVILEALEDFLYMADAQIAKEAHRHFKRQGLDIRLGAKVTGVKTEDQFVTVDYEDGAGGTESGGR